MSKNPTYDPNKRYTWTPSDEFKISGEQFGLILNAIRGVISTPEAIRILTAEKANNALEEVMIRAVETGVVKEIPDEPVN